MSLMVGVNRELMVCPFCNCRLPTSIAQAQYLNHIQVKHNIVAEADVRSALLHLEQSRMANPHLLQVLPLHQEEVVGFSESKRSTEEDPTTGRQGAEPPDGPPASTVTISKIGTEEKCLIKTISEHQDMEKLITDREQNMPRPPGQVPSPGLTMPGLVISEVRDEVLAEKRSEEASTCTASRIRFSPPLSRGEEGDMQWEEVSCAADVTDAKCSIQIVAKDGGEVSSDSEKDAVVDKKISEGNKALEAVAGKTDIDGRKTVERKKSLPGKKCVPGKKSVPGKKYMAGKKYMTGKKYVTGKKSVPGKTSVLDKKSVPGKKSLPGKKCVPGKKSVPEEKSVPERTGEANKKTASRNNILMTGRLNKKAVAGEKSGNPTPMSNQNVKEGEKKLAKKVVAKLEVCSVCEFKGVLESKMFKLHLLKHYGKDLRKEFAEALTEKQCPFSDHFKSDSKDGSHRNDAMLRHIGVTHGKVVKYHLLQAEVNKECPKLKGVNETWDTQLPEVNVEVCSVCKFEGQLESKAFKRHLLKHYSKDLREEFAETLSEKDCSLCSNFKSCSADEGKRREIMVRHVGVTHGEVIKYHLEKKMQG